MIFLSVCIGNHDSSGTKNIEWIIINDVLAKSYPSWEESPCLYLTQNFKGFIFNITKQPDTSTYKYFYYMFKKYRITNKSKFWVKTGSTQNTTAAINGYNTNYGITESGWTERFYEGLNYFNVYIPSGFNADFIDEPYSIFNLQLQKHVKYVSKEKIQELIELIKEKYNK